MTTLDINGPCSECGKPLMELVKDCQVHKDFWEARYRKGRIKDQIAFLVDCRCCPLNEDAIEKIATFLIDGLGYTDGELATGVVEEEIDSLYNYENWTYGNRKEHSDV